MLAAYLPIVVFFFLALIVGSVMLLIGVFIRPKNDYAAKNSPYECGVEPYSDALGRVKPRYYIYAMLFLAFDVEAIFLFPWAIVFDRLGVFALIEMFLFMAIVVLGLLYAWYKGALKWVS